MTMDESGTIITMTITAVPWALNGERGFADAVITVDFAEIAAHRMTNAVASKSGKATALFDAVIVNATNIRALR